MKKILLILMLFIGTTVAAQDYEQAIGIRAGYSGGISYKRFFNAWYSGEVLVQYNRNGFQLTGLAERQDAVFNTDRLYLYYGGGVYTGNWNGLFALGLTGICGVEYVLRDLPLAFSLDYKPMLNIIRVTTFDPFDFALGLKYTF